MDFRAKFYELPEQPSYDKNASDQGRPARTTYVDLHRFFLQIQ